MPLHCGKDFFVKKGDYILRFIEHYLYSFEGQTTIGYGSRNPKDNFAACKWIIFVQTLQPIFATALEGCLILFTLSSLADHSRVVNTELFLFSSF